MDRNPVALIVCLLAVAPATLFVSTDASAIADDHSPLIAGTEPIPDFSGVTRAPEPDQPLLEDPTNDGTTVPEVVLSPESAPPGTTANESAASIPCLSSFKTGSTADSAPETGACEATGGRKRLSLQFGSRMSPGSGLLGEVDGVRVDYRLTGGMTVNGVAGYPVLSDKDQFNTTRQIYGFSADTGKIARVWDLNSYLIEQQTDGKATSRAAGGAIRYLRPKRSLLMLVDYDLNTDTLGAFTTSGALALPFHTTLSATVDVRNNPINHRQQQYLQRSAAMMEGWTLDLPVDRIKHYTVAGSDEVTTLSLGLTHTFSERVRMSGSFAMLEASGETDADSTTGAPPSEYFYRLKLSGNDLLFSGTLNRLDLSHRITDSSRVSSAAIDSNYAINRRWKVSPRLRTDYRDSLLDRSVQWVTSPSVKMEYRWRRQYGVNIEAGGEWTTRELPDADESRSSYFLSLGYKANF